jgi:hydroxyacylglutathione hydrolase
MSDQFPQLWIHGAPDCQAFDGPAFQVHPFTDSTFIIRQHKCLNFEGPFLYLLVGEHTAFLLDSGAAPTNDAPLLLRPLIDALLAKILAARGQDAVGLIVGHSHSHADHLAGDRAFATRPATRVIGPTLAAIKSAYGVPAWPRDLGTVDLGGRVLTVIPTPGHEAHHICVYDSATRILLSGDLLYPGKLVIHDWPAYRKSAAQLAAFARDHTVSYVLGAHIEMKNTPGELYEIGTTYQPHEHVLQLGPSHLQEWAEACASMGAIPRIDVHDDFILWPVES